VNLRILLLGALLATVACSGEPDDATSDTAAAATAESTAPLAYGIYEHGPQTAPGKPGNGGETFRYLELLSSGEFTAYFSQRSGEKLPRRATGTYRIENPRSGDSSRVLQLTPQNVAPSPSVYPPASASGPPPSPPVPAPSPSGPNPNPPPSAWVASTSTAPMTLKATPTSIGSYRFTGDGFLSFTLDPAR
jgi:hypothetical protein